MASGDFKVIASPDSVAALTNCAVISKDAWKSLGLESSRPHVMIKGHILKAMVHEAIRHKNEVALNGVHRRSMQLQQDEVVLLQRYREKNANCYLSQVVVEIRFYGRNDETPNPFEVKQLAKAFKAFDGQYLTVNQLILLELFGTLFLVKVMQCQVVDIDSLRGKSKELPVIAEANYGILSKRTEIRFMSPADGVCAVNMRGTSSSGAGSSGLMRADWSFESMGIGGLDEEFSGIFRRAFSSRLFPPDVIKQLGIKHVKGILLYGPPGTGKTLMARQIGKMLNCKDLKVVNGPEIFSKYVGESEKKIRELFKEAEEEQKARGDDSELHIIIFDEFDAICRSRGSTSSGTGVSETVVNQLLSKIDGVEALDNILIIGMTNRKDMIDEAVLRPGRLEVHMEIGLPDDNGRLQILRIKTKDMATNGLMKQDVSLEELCGLTKNYTGAEIEGLVKSAASFAMKRLIDIDNLGKAKDLRAIQVGRDDFLSALSEVLPRFGADDDEFANCMTNGVIQYSDRFIHLLRSCNQFVNQVRATDRTPLMSVLLEGDVGAGKTALAAYLAAESKFPFIKLLSPEHMIGQGESSRISKLSKVFDDAYKSELSVVVVDNIERLLDYVRIGPRFSNNILQTLFLLLKRMPPPGRRLLIIGTTSNRSFLEDVGLVDAFNAVFNVPSIREGEEVHAVLKELGCFTEEDLKLVSRSIHRHIPIKKLLMIAEMARLGEPGQIAERFVKALQDFGVE